MIAKGVSYHFRLLQMFTKSGQSVCQICCPKSAGQSHLQASNFAFHVLPGNSYSTSFWMWHRADILQRAPATGCPKMLFHVHLLQAVLLPAGIGYRILTRWVLKYLKFWVFLTLTGHKTSQHHASLWRVKTPRSSSSLSRSCLGYYMMDEHPMTWQRTWKT